MTYRIQLKDLTDYWTKIGERDLRLEIYEGDTLISKFSKNIAFTTPAIKVYSLTDRKSVAEYEYDWLSGIASVRLWDT